MEITKNTSVEELLKKYPSLTRTFIQLGIPCLVCGEPFWGTVEDLACQNGKDVTQIVDKLNEKRQKINEKV